MRALVRSLLPLVFVACAACTKPAHAPHARLLPAPDGDVPALVRAQAAASAAEGRRVLVYAGASWCEPCERFHQAADNGELDDLLGKVDLVVFDLDRDAQRLQEGGYGSRMIPLLVVPDASGRGTDQRMEGSIKGDRAVDEMRPRLKALLGT